MPSTPSQQKILDRFTWDQKQLVTEYSMGGIAVYLEEFPVTEGHMLFVPLESTNINLAMNKALMVGREKVTAKEWDAFNLGMNHGEAAGQTVNWPHVHLIPRMRGDCKDPSGGIRGVIPKLQNWKTAAKYKKIRKAKGID